MANWVRVMADYCSDGLWQQDGGMMGREDLPISPELAKRHEDWCYWYETLSWYVDEQKPDVLKKPDDLKVFAKEGLAVAKAIKAELPDWTVIYFDEEKNYARNNMDVPRSEYEYEI